MVPEPRELIYQALIASPAADALTAIWEDRLYQFSSFTEAPKGRPFGVLKMNFSTESILTRGVGRTQPFQLWVHDRPGDYNNIDTIIHLAKGLLEAIPNQGDFLEIVHTGTSDDFQDDGFDTIVRYAQFGLAAT